MTSKSASNGVVSGRPGLRTRLASVAVAIAILYGMFNGERWLLEHSPASANELVVATCVVDVVFGDGIAADPCLSVGTSGEGKSSSE